MNKPTRIIALIVAITFTAETCLWAAPMPQKQSAYLGRPCTMRPVRKAEQALANDQPAPPYSGLGIVSPEFSNGETATAGMAGVPIRRREFLAFFLQETIITVAFLSLLNAFIAGCSRRRAPQLRRPLSEKERRFANNLKTLDEIGLIYNPACADYSPEAARRVKAIRKDLEELAGASPELLRIDSLSRMGVGVEGGLEAVYAIAEYYKAQHAKEYPVLQEIGRKLSSSLVAAEALRCADQLIMLGKDFSVTSGIWDSADTYINFAKRAGAEADAALTLLAESLAFYFYLRLPEKKKIVAKVLKELPNTWTAACAYTYMAEEWLFDQSDAVKYTLPFRNENRHFLSYVDSAIAILERLKKNRALKLHRSVFRNHIDGYSGLFELDRACDIPSLHVLPSRKHMLQHHHISTTACCRYLKTLQRAAELTVELCPENRDSTLQTEGAVGKILNSLHSLHRPELERSLLHRLDTEILYWIISIGGRDVYTSILIAFYKRLEGTLGYRRHNFLTFLERIDPSQRWTSGFFFITAQLELLAEHFNREGAERLPALALDAQLGRLKTTLERQDDFKWLWCADETVALWNIIYAALTCTSPAVAAIAEKKLLESYRKEKKEMKIVLGFLISLGASLVSPKNRQEALRIRRDRQNLIAIQSCEEAPDGLFVNNRMRVRQFFYDEDELTLFTDDFLERGYHLLGRRHPTRTIVEKAIIGADGKTRWIRILSRVIDPDRGNKNAVSDMKDLRVGMLIHRGHSITVFDTFPCLQPKDAIQCVPPKLCYLASCGRSNDITRLLDSYPTTQWIRCGRIGYLPTNNSVIYHILEAFGSGVRRWDDIVGRIPRQLVTGQNRYYFPSSPQFKIELFVKELAKISVTGPKTNPGHSPSGLSQQLPAPPSAASSRDDAASVADDANKPANDETVTVGMAVMARPSEIKRIKTAPFL